MIKLNKNRDLTTGSITGGLWPFAVPLMLGNVFQQFYNLVNTWMVGKYVGNNALAAVGSSYDRFFVYGFKQGDRTNFKLKITASRRTQFVQTVCNVKKHIMPERSIATVCTNNQNLCY